VLDAIVETSARVCASDASTISCSATASFIILLSQATCRASAIFARNPASIDELFSDGLVREKRTLHFANVMDDPELSRSAYHSGCPRALLVARPACGRRALGAIVFGSRILAFYAAANSGHRSLRRPSRHCDIECGAVRAGAGGTRDLTESLEQQTATSEVLQVISTTPVTWSRYSKYAGRTQRAFAAANFGLMNLYKEGSFRQVANYNVPAVTPPYG